MKRLRTHTECGKENSYDHTEITGHPGGIGQLACKSCGEKFFIDLYKEHQQDLEIMSCIHDKMASWKEKK